MRRPDRLRDRRPAAAALVLALAAIAACETGPPELGPADGEELTAVDTGRVAVGDTAPDFTLRSRTGETATLSGLRGRRVILVFYRGHW